MAHIAMPRTLSLFISAALIILLMLLALSCATPRSPRGGPGDKTGPKLLAQFPQSGTVNYTKTELFFGFDDFLDRPSVAKALSIEPDFGIPFNIKHGRKSFKLSFEQALPENTTVIVKLGTDLKDTDGNKLEKPIDLAFSTGPRIDKAALNGRVLKAEDGMGESGLRVLLYEQQQALDQPARYVAETDTAGIFRFDYLREGAYRIFWADDNNRNRIIDTDREYYASFPTEFIQLKEDTVAIAPPIFITRDDTTAPALYEVGLLTTNRLNLIFSEPVEYDSLTKAVLTDSSGTNVGVDILYSDAKRPENLLLESYQSLTEDMTYSLELSDIRDVAGNRVEVRFGPFEGSNQKDTVQQALIPNGLKDDYFEDEPLIFQFKKRISEPALVDSFFVNAQNELFKPWEKVMAKSNRLIVQPDSLWDLEGLVFNVWDLQEFSYQSFEPSIWTKRELGELEVRFPKIAQKDSLAHFELRLFDDEERIYVNRRLNTLNYADSTFFIASLPPKNLKLVVFLDRNGNRRYDMGQLTPFVTSEPYFMEPRVDIRSGFITDLTIDFEREQKRLIQRLTAESATDSTATNAADSTAAVGSTSQFD